MTVGGFLSIVNTQEKRKKNHLSDILIKMMQDPFSQQDTEMEKASPNISFLTSNN